MKHGVTSRPSISTPRARAILAFVKRHTTEIVITSHGPGMIELTDRVVARVRATQVATGLLTLHVKHTSASLLIQENEMGFICRREWPAA